MAKYQWTFLLTKLKENDKVQHDSLVSTDILN